MYNSINNKERYDQKFYKQRTLRNKKALIDVEHNKKNKEKISVGIS